MWPENLATFDVVWPCETSVLTLIAVSSPSLRMNDGAYARFRTGKLMLCPNSIWRVTCFNNNPSATACSYSHCTARCPFYDAFFRLKSSPRCLEYIETPSRSLLFMMWISSLTSALLVLTPPVLAGIHEVWWNITYVENANPDGLHPRRVIGVNGTWP